MAVLLVLCDSADSALVAGALKEYGETFRLSRSNYLLSTDKGRDEVWRELRKCTEFSAREALVVLELKKPFRGGAISGEVDRWLQRISDKPDASED